MTYNESFGAPPHQGGQSGGIMKNSGCSRSLGCLLALSLLFNFAVIGGGMMFAKKPGPTSKLKEIWISGAGKKKIAVVQVRGAIMDGARSSSNIAAAGDIVAQLNKAQRDRRVKGTLILANSPGGGVTASDKIYQAVKALSKVKPVAVLMGDVCASGCVYMSANSTKIFAHPTSVTGSIGVITSSLNFHKMLEKIGVEGVTIASKKNKALLSPYKPINPEHKAILKKIIDEMYLRFVDIMSKGRKIPKETMLKIADGRVFSGVAAKKLKLVDEIGYQSDALKWLMKKAGLSSARLVKYRQQVGFAELLLGVSQLPQEIKSSRQLSIEKLLGVQSPRILYMYSSGLK